MRFNKNSLNKAHVPSKYASDEEFECRSLAAAAAVNMIKAKNKHPSDPAIVDLKARSFW
jgi:hypothetical protein